MIFREIAFGSAEFEAERALRDGILRAPLGLSLGDEDPAPEREQLHYGLFDADGTLAACVVAVPLSPDSAKIRQMAVAGARRGQGLGARLMRELEAALQARGCTRLVLHARESAVGFYEKLGYRALGEPFVEVTVPHRRMEKTLPRPDPAPR